MFFPQEKNLVNSFTGFFIDLTNYFISFYIIHFLLSQCKHSPGLSFASLLVNSSQGCITFRMSYNYCMLVIFTVTRAESHC